jgi:hypothetical protein
MKKSTVTFDHDAAGGHQALLTLRRGVSAFSTWVFDEQDAGRTITLGSASGCAWQIASPGVSQQLLAFTGENLLVRSLKPDDRVRLNGWPLPEGWVELAHGDILEIGQATLAVSLAPALRKNTTAPPKRGERKRRQQRRAKAPVPPPQREQATPRHSSGSALVLHRDSLRNAPVLFQEHDSQPVSPQTLYRFVVAALATVVAYAAWVALLDLL